MQIDIAVDSLYAAANEFAKVCLVTDGDKHISELDVEFSPLLAACGIPSKLALDFLLFAASVYAIDKVVRRDSANDLWTRDFLLSLPVSNPELWALCQPDINRCLSFLTGDQWELTFTTLTSRLNRPKSRRRITRSFLISQLTAPIKASAVCLFSGGLDSLIGAIDWLEDNPEKTLCLIAHHDGEVAGPMSDQNALIGPLKKKYKDRVRLLQVRVGEKSLDGAGDSKRETTFRSRSILFLALGLYVASACGDGTPILIPENGTIALNVPLTPSRRGSCSTRTAHPYYLTMLEKIFSKLGFDHPIENSLMTKTKGECVAKCNDPELLREIALLSVSCAKRGHKKEWIRRNAKECGRCMPCIYRRAALHKVGMDTEPYGCDVCLGEVDVQNDEMLADDLRACLSFLRRHPTKEEIAMLLLENGKLDLNLLPEYASVVERAMDEIRILLRDKATFEIRQLAGL